MLLHADRAAPGLTRAPPSVATDVRGREGRVSEEESVSRTRISTGDARYGWANGSERRLLPFLGEAVFPWHGIPAVDRSTAHQLRYGSASDK